jgi:lipoprotein-anchoring transpeptidase ErfK/SrfK
VNQRFVALVKLIARPEGVQGRWAAVDLYEQTLVAYEDDTPVFATLVSTGLPGWDTNEGIFTVWARLIEGNQSGATGAPDSYALESVPWIMYFDGDISFHGAYWHDDFGYRRSHGCVNMTISDARYLFEWTEASTPDENGEIVTHVYVYSSGTYV